MTGAPDGSVVYCPLLEADGDPYPYACTRRVRPRWWKPSRRVPSCSACGAMLPHPGHVPVVPPIPPRV